MPSVCDNMGQGQVRTGHLAYRSYARWAVQNWGHLGSFGALKMHQNALKCPWGSINGPKRPRIRGPKK